jgi:hypothetical protein
VSSVRATSPRLTPLLCDVAGRPRLALAVRGLGIRLCPSRERGRAPVRTCTGASPRASPTTPDLIRADAAWSAGCGFAMTDNIRGAYFQTRNLLLCLRLGDRELVAKALATEVCFRSTGGRKAEALTATLLVREWELAREVRTPKVTAMAHAATGYHHFMMAGLYLPAIAAFVRS